jgi:hypothetical protein
MIDMKPPIYGLALAALLAVAPAFAGYAEDATTPPPPAESGPPAATTPPPQTETPAQTTTQTQSSPVSVARPAIVPRAIEPPSSRDAAADAPPPQQRHSARRRDRGYASFLQPFPIYVPHLYRNRIVWSRLPWFSF